MPRTQKHRQNGSLWKFFSAADFCPRFCRRFFATLRTLPDLRIANVQPKRDVSKERARARELARELTPESYRPPPSLESYRPGLCQDSWRRPAGYPRTSCDSPPAYAWTRPCPIAYINIEPTVVCSTVVTILMYAIGQDRIFQSPENRRAIPGRPGIARRPTPGVLAWAGAPNTSKVFGARQKMRRNFSGRKKVGAHFFAAGQKL